MSEKIKILILEDNKSDEELLKRELNKSGLNISTEVVQTRETFEAALDEFSPDIILSDYSMPAFDGITAFHIKQKKYPDIPFIIVSGTIGEENAVQLIKNGVNDYALKDKLFALMPKITRALKEEKEKKGNRIANEKLIIEHQKLIQAEAEIRSFARHLNQVLEDEMTAIAREIHDELGQQLASIKIGLLLFKTPHHGAMNHDEKATELIKSVDDLMQSLRKISTHLRPGILDSLGLIPSIEWLAKEFEKKTDIKCYLELNSNEEKFEKNISTCFFRICQESLTNIFKHARANKVVIEARKSNNELLLKITDNGKGITSEKLENPFSMGLLGMRERANIIGADLKITSKKDEGTTVQLKVNIN